jgi:hypothetical protein
MISMLVTALTRSLDAGFPGGAGGLNHDLLGGKAPGPPLRSGRAWPAAASFARNDRSVRRQEIVTVEGGEAIPLATTTSVLLPLGVPGGRVNLVEDLVPGLTDTELQLLVRA